ncbi:MAG: TIM44-like domain-containing protein [Methylococcales bacterium]
MKVISAIFLSVLLMLCTWQPSGMGFNEAQARPGGGHSSSGHSSGGSRSGSRSSGGSSWSGSTSTYRSNWGNSYSSRGGTAVSMSEAEFFFALLMVAILIIVLINLRRGGGQSVYSAPTVMIKNWHSDQLANDFAELQAIDPNFSKVLLLDFVHSLYTKFYSYRGKSEFSYLTPFLAAELQNNEPAPLVQATIDEVVINAIHWQELKLSNPQQDSLVLVVDANYSQHLQGKNTRYTVTERWQLVRAKGVLSQEPKKMQSLSCPHCAAPAHFNDAGVCPYCKNLLQQGAEQWYLKQRAVLQTTVLDAADLVTYAQEAGSDLMTIKAADLPERLTQFQQLHAIENWDAFWQAWCKDIVQSYFTEIYRHWSQRDWNGVRHLLSDRLYEANQFWTDRYQQHNWFNRLDNLNIERIILTKIELDRFYEAVTVRIFAGCYDYTEDAQGKLIGGSKRELRKYSEYWTFVRRTGVDNNSADFKLGQCPHCGAPADQMGQAGECGYCGSKISTGEFSWVLFLIMQDDVYSG